MKTLLDTLSTLGLEPLRLGKTIVLPFGGRVIGLCPQPDINVLWTHPSLGAATSARELLASGWVNLGGDRTWISPEHELFVSDASRPDETYRVPLELDPGCYSVVSQSATAVVLKTSVAVNFYRSGCQGRFSITKKVTELEAPGFSIPEGVYAAGYELACTLVADGSLPTALRPALWNLLQVPSGGEIVVPVQGAATPITYFGKQQWQKSGARLTASVPAASEPYKFGVLADHSKGLMVFLRLNAPQPFVILRRFSVAAPELYFDAPFNDPQQRGVVQQIYVDNGALGGFGEIEYHTPAMAPDLCSEVRDVCTTWAFAGPAQALSELVERVIGQLQEKGE